MPSGDHAGALSCASDDLRQIADAAVFDRHGKNVAARFKNSALALWAETVVLNEIGDVDLTLSTIDAVVRNIDRNVFSFFGANVKNFQLAVLFVNDMALIVGGRPANVPIADSA